MTMSEIILESRCPISQSTKLLTAACGSSYSTPRKIYSYTDCTEKRNYTQDVPILNHPNCSCRLLASTFLGSNPSYGIPMGFLWNFLWKNPSLGCQTCILCLLKPERKLCLIKCSSPCDMRVWQAV